MTGSGPPGPDPLPERWARVLEEGIQRLRALAGNRTLRLVSLLVVLPAFGVALFLAWRGARVELTEIALLPLAAVGAAVPFTVLAATWQLRAMSLAAGARISWWKTFRVVTLGTLSGLLPVSSGSVVRAGAVLVWGDSAGSAGWALAFDALVWICVSLIYSSGAAFLAGAREVAVLMAVGGVLLVPVVLLLRTRLVGGSGAFQVTAARVAGMLVDVVRLQACFFALGVSVTFAEASTLAAASPLASIFFFLPGGLGVREAFTSAVGAAVGLSAAAAFLAAALNRLVGLSVLLVAEVAVQLWPGRAKGGGAA